MKKFIIFAVIMLAGMAAAAQGYTLYGQKDQTYFKSTTDVTITNTTAAYIVIDASASVDFPATQFLYAEIDSVSGNHTAIAVTLFGKNFDGEDWTSITISATDLGVNSALPVKFTTSAETRWRKYKVVFTGTGTGVSTLDNLEFKLYKPD
jgi:hypothetical protein